MNSAAATGVESVLSCEAAEIRGTLRHSHIANRFLFYRDATLLLRAIQEHGGELRELSARLVQLTADVDGGFSPGARMPMLRAFRMLPLKAQRELLDSLRAHYDVGFRPAARAAALDVVTQAFLRALDCFVESGGTADTHEALRNAAVRLERELAALPAGAWLWP